MSIDLEDQYDKIYRYCYFRLHNQETAEDITQETFLRYFEKYRLSTAEQTMKCLYTIARNLCTDEYRRKHPESLQESSVQEDWEEEQLLTSLAVKSALSELEGDEQELLLLRYVNEVPVSVIGQILGISRFAVHRRLKSASEKLKDKLGKEEFN